jgi:hypothetical protein
MLQQKETAMSLEIHDAEWVRDSENDVVVNISYHFTPGLAAQTSGPPEACWPAEPAEVDIIRVWDDTCSDIELTDEELHSAQIHILENHQEDDRDWDRIREDRWEKSRLSVEYSD